MKLKLIFASLFVATTAFPKSGDVSKSPIMGWASWNYFSVNINDSIIRQQADSLVSTGLSSIGYRYINIDDGFFNGRYSDGTFRIDTVKFPYGMKSLVDYIHAKNLKAGFYSDAGANTCGSQYNGQTGGVGGGMYNHDQQDANLFFKIWGFDFLKVDYCGGLTLKLDEKNRYTAIKNAIDSTGKNVNYNVCRWQFPGTWVTGIADSWRISQDITFDKYAHWDRVLMVIDNNKYLSAYANQGHYNDMDMIPIGRGLTYEEDKSMFSMWCIMSSPIVLGNDLTNMTKQTKSILTNTELIAINQDSTGIQAQIISDNGAGLQVWAKPLNGRQSNERAVVLFNRSNSSANMTVNWKEINLTGPANVQDLWSHTDLGSMDSGYNVNVVSHGVVVLKVTGKQNRLQENFEGEYSWINNFNLTKNSIVIADQGKVTEDALCSGGAKASWIGNGADNYIEWRYIYADSAGYYNCSLTFESGENRNATVNINGLDTLLTKLNSGGWEIPKDITFSIKLKKGYNTIRISNASAWLPNIDKIKIHFYKKETTTSIKLQDETLGISKVYPNPCTDNIQVETYAQLKKVEIYSLSGTKQLSSNCSIFPTNNLSPSIYVLKVITEEGFDTHLITKQ